MRRGLRGAAHALALVTIALCLLLARSRYDWVADVAPDLDPRSFEDGGDRDLVLGLFVVAAMTMEGAGLLSARTVRERWTAGVLLVALVLAIGSRLLG